MDQTRYEDALPLKGAIEELIGAEAWYRLKDTRSVCQWQEELLRVLKISKVAIRATIDVVDSGQIDRLVSFIGDAEKEIRSAKTLIDVFAAFSACYLRLSFQQLGDMPDRTGRPSRIRATEANWRMDTYRSVQYVQSAKQKLWVAYKDDPRDVVEKALDPTYMSLRR